MSIVRIVPIAAMSLATGIWYGGAAFAGSVYIPATPIVDSGPSLIVSVKGRATIGVVRKCCATTGIAQED